MNTHFKWYSFYDLTILELYCILQLRQQVFIVEQNCAYLDCDDLDQQCFHLIGWDGGPHLLNPVAYLRLRPPDTQHQSIRHASLNSVNAQQTDIVTIGRVLTNQKTRKLGLGRKMVVKALQRCNEDFPDAPIKVSAQTYLQNFYQSFGFDIFGKEYEEDNIPHVEMIKAPGKTGAGTA